MKKVRIILNSNEKFLKALDPSVDIHHQVDCLALDPVMQESLCDIEYHLGGGYYYCSRINDTDHEITFSGDNGVVSLFSRIVEY